MHVLQYAIKGLEGYSHHGIPRPGHVMIDLLNMDNVYAIVVTV